MYKTVYTEVEIDVDEVLSEIETDVLITEINRRQSTETLQSDLFITLLTSIYDKKRNGIDFDEELDELIYNFLGRVV